MVSPKVHKKDTVTIAEKEKIPKLNGANEKREFTGQSNGNKQRIDEERAKPPRGLENRRNDREDMHRGSGGYRGTRDGNTRNQQVNGTGEECSEPRQFKTQNGRGEKRNDGQQRDTENEHDDEVVIRPPVYIPPAQSTDEADIFSQNISSGINFKQYDKIPVKVTGENAPAHCNTFAETGLHETLLENVRKSGYEQPTPIQKHAIPVLLAGRDLMGCAQTGSGKTAAYLLPILNALKQNGKPLETGFPQALVMAPTRELAIQVK